MNLKLTQSSRRLFRVAMSSFLVLSLTSAVSFAQDTPYQTIRLNDGNPIVDSSMFATSSEGLNINGPSLIRIPDWIPTSERADSSAKYYLYFAKHDGDYIRMAWAADIEGPYELWDNHTSVGDRGVLDNNSSTIYLDNDLSLPLDHLASPDVTVDDENEQIIMYFHTGSYNVGSELVDDQVTFVATSDDGLEFYDGIEGVAVGSSYFRTFEYNGDLYALDNGAKLNIALDANDPWDAPSGFDYTDVLWERNPEHIFADVIPESTAELRVRHTGARVVGDELHVFYTKRGDFQERIQLSTIDMGGDWEDWVPSYPAYEVLTANPGWEGGEIEMEDSELGDATDVNQLRDPDVFEDTDGQLYLIYTGSGEAGIGIAKLYETPNTSVTLTPSEAAYARDDSSKNFSSQSRVTVSTGSDASDKRTIYMQFDLSDVSDIEHAAVRMYASSTTGGPVTVYKTSNNWEASSITGDNAPSLGDAIATHHLTDVDEYYDWNITEYANDNAGSIISIAFDIAPSNTSSHSFELYDTSNPAELLLSSELNETDTSCTTVTIDDSDFDSKWGIWTDGGIDSRRKSIDREFANGGTGMCVRLRDDSTTSVTTTSDLELSDYEEITVDFNFIAESIEWFEEFWLQVSTDGGKTFKTVETWKRSEDFRNNLRYYESKTIEQTFTDETQFRFRLDASSDADAIYIDDIKITGCRNSSITASSISSISAKASVSVEQTTIYPNPSDEYVDIQTEGISVESLYIYDATGRGIESYNINYNLIQNDTFSIRTDELESGIYILQLNLVDGTTETHKLVVKH